MKGLEETLEEIEDMRMGLSAEIVVQEEKKHRKEELLSGYRQVSGHDRQSYMKDVWVTGQERITKPDKEKQMVSRIALREQFESCEWYSGRYVAAQVLNIDSDILNIRLKGYLRELGKDLRADTKVGDYSVELKKGHRANTKLGKYICMVDDGEEKFRNGEYIMPGKKKEYLDVFGPDLGKRSIAMKDLVKLYALTNKSSVVEEVLGEAYENEVVSIRKMAGRELGYSWLKIWWHELFG